MWNLRLILNSTALIYAARYGNTEIARELLKKKDIDVNIVDILIRKKFIIFKSNFFYGIQVFNHLWNSRRIFNNTALIYATIRGHTEIVRELLTKESIDINIKNIFI